MPLNDQHTGVPGAAARAHTHIRTQELREARERQAVLENELKEGALQHTRARTHTHAHTHTIAHTLMSLWRTSSKKVH